MMDAHAVAADLERADSQLMRRMGVRGSDDLYPYRGAPKKRWMMYQLEVGKMLRRKGFSKKNKVPVGVREILQDHNYHPLNQAIDFLGMGAGGHYGLGDHKAFFSREEYYKNM